VVADAGHDVHLDQPGGWQRAIEDFLAGLANAPAS
jgi:pimeloyl-ACP methyl ester carboxylesterase